MESNLPKDANREPTSSPTPEAPRIPIDTVLVVEDSKPMNAVVKTMFRSLGFNVIEFSDGSGARKFIEDSSPLELIDVALVFSDYMMPELDGISFLKFVRAHPVLANIPFVIATAAATSDLVTQAKSEKVSGLFVKPISNKRLTELVQKLFPQKKLPVRP